LIVEHEGSDGTVNTAAHGNQHFSFTAHSGNKLTGKDNAESSVF
jgi:hypothetical protein